MGVRQAIGMATIVVGVLGGSAVQGSILTFDLADSGLDPLVYPGGFPEGYGYATLGFGFSPLSGYGSRVTGPTGANGNGTTTFEYGVGAEGYTPNVTAEFGPHGILTGGPVLWREGFGDLTNVLYQELSNSYLDIVLRADPFYDVQLYGFDLGGYQDELPADAVTVFNGIPFPFLTPTNQIFEEFDVDTPGPGGGAKSYAFATPLQAHLIYLRIDTTGLDQSLFEFIGIDNIRFGQTLRSDGTSGEAAVPEPSSLALLGLGAGIGAIRIRRRRLNPRSVVTAI